eukprot:287022_1
MSAARRSSFGESAVIDSVPSRWLKSKIYLAAPSAELKLQFNSLEHSVGATELMLAVFDISFTNCVEEFSNCGDLHVMDVQCNFKTPEETKQILTWNRDIARHSSGKLEEEKVDPVVTCNWSSAAATPSSSLRIVELTGFYVWIPLDVLQFVSSLARNSNTGVSSRSFHNSNQFAPTPIPSAAISLDCASNTLKLILSKCSVRIGDETVSALLSWDQVFLLKSPTSIQACAHHIRMTDVLEANFTRLSFSIGGDFGPKRFLEPVDLAVSRTRARKAPEDPAGEPFAEECVWSVFAGVLNVRLEPDHLMAAKQLRNSLIVPAPTNGPVSANDGEAMKPYWNDTVNIQSRRFFQDDLRGMKVSKEAGGRPKSGYVVFAADEIDNGSRWMSWRYPAERVVTHIACGALVPHGISEEFKKSGILRACALLGQRTGRVGHSGRIPRLTGIVLQSRSAVPSVRGGMDDRVGAGRRGGSSGRRRRTNISYITRVV